MPIYIGNLIKIPVNTRLSNESIYNGQINNVTNNSNLSSENNNETTTNENPFTNTTAENGNVTENTNVINSSDEAGPYIKNVLGYANNDDISVGVDSTEPDRYNVELKSISIVVSNKGAGLIGYYTVYPNGAWQEMGPQQPLNQYSN